MTEPLAGRGELTDRAIDLVWREARLLDAKRYQEWDGLWAPEGLYVVPIDREARTPEEFAATLNLVLDDERMRRMRIERLTGGNSISASAAARTVRTVSCFQVEDSGPGWIELGSAQVLVGYKREETFVLGADLSHRIVFDGEDGEDGEGGQPRIKQKVIRLLNSDTTVSASGFLL
jgi:3-phenylpropionate/cinnamic acid dioxygenase small subunit